MRYCDEAVSQCFSTNKILSFSLYLIFFLELIGRTPCLSDFIEHIYGHLRGQNEKKNSECVCCFYNTFI